jgi:hypothetical protein
MKTTLQDCEAGATNAVDDGIRGAIRALYPDTDPDSPVFDKALLRAVYCVALAHEMLALSEFLPQFIISPAVVAIRQMAKWFGVLGKLGYDGSVFDPKFSFLDAPGKKPES